MAKFVWDDEKHYWPEAYVKEWERVGWDWASLEEKKSRNFYLYDSLQEFWRPEFQLDFAANREPISESEYWAERWLTEFPIGSNKLWTPYHLPLFDATTGELSPKHHDYTGSGKWTNLDEEAFRLGLVARLLIFHEDENQPEDRPMIKLNGLVFFEGFCFGKIDHEFRVDLSGSLIAPNVFFGQHSDEHRKSLFPLAKPLSFLNGTKFEGVAFGDGIVFSGSKFGHFSSFDNSYFVGDVEFMNCEMGATSFGGCSIIGGAMFYGTKFDGFVNFEGALLGKGFNFSATKIGGFLFFDGATFLGNADFALGLDPNSSWEIGRIEESSLGNFNDAENGSVQDQTESIYSISLNNNYRWAEEAALSSLRCREVLFAGDVSFNNRIFLHGVDFANSIFMQIPNFHGAVFDSNMNFTGSTFFPAPGKKITLNEFKVREKRYIARVKSDIEFAKKEISNSEPSLKEQEKERFLSTLIQKKLRLKYALMSSHGKERCFIDHHVSTIDLDEEHSFIWGHQVEKLGKAAKFERAYRQLKNLMNANRARNEENRFFTLEMRSRIARRDSEIKFSEKLFTRLYGVLSGYGLSITLPLLWILVLSLITVVIYVALTPNWSGENIGDMSTVYFQQLLPFFLAEDISVLTSQGVENKWLEDISNSGNFRGLIFNGTSITYSIVNVLLWFLFALALRRRFQID